MHRTSPSATFVVPFLYSSAFRSNNVPTSSLFRRPSHTCRSGTAASVLDASSARGSACQVPISAHGFPPAKFTPPESWYLTHGFPL